jgi:hypothetical protein
VTEDRAGPADLAEEPAHPAGPADPAERASAVALPRPAFLDELSRSHYARLARCIVLTGNVDDLFVGVSPDGPRYVGLERLLRDAFHRARYPTTGREIRFIVLTLRSDGIAFAADEDRLVLADLVTQLAPPHDDLGAQLVTILREVGRERSSGLVTVTLVAELLRLVARIRRRGVRVPPIAAILDHAETLLPAGDTARMAPLDRESVKVFADLLRDDEIWAEAETADAYPDVLLLLAPAAAELNARIAGLPKVATVSVPTPDEATRSAFLRDRIAAPGARPVALEAGYTLESLGRDSRGLTLRALDDLVTGAQRDPDTYRLDRAAVVAAVNRVLQDRLGSIIRVVYPDHTMADVVGFTGLKQRLVQLRRRFDDPERAPAGITVVGPNGAGKTFILEAFAAETERTVITLAQVRSEWYGKTDVFAEMFERGVSAFGRILVLVDEAHVAFGSIHARDTHETEARLTRHIIQMIDDLGHRSRIVWALITTRPDLLDPDFVRAGRCSVFVPIFDPEGDDVDAFAAWIERRLAKAGVVLSAEERALFRARSPGFSAGDFREFADDFADERAFDPSRSLDDFLAGWTPTSVALARPRELQILLAALNGDWPELLPERLRGMGKDEIAARIEQLRGRLA